MRVTGGDPQRLEVAARHAAEAGLEVWWSPFTCDLTADELLDLLAVCAEGAERLRRQGAEVPARINDFLTRAVEVVGARFGGRVSYASLPLEGVDWAAFDLISTDAGYRSIELGDRRGRTYPDMAWEPKAAFTALADCHRG